MGLKNWEHRVTATGFPFDMAAWCEEKSSNVVEAATRMVESVRAASLPSEVREQMLADLRIILWHGSKLASFATGTAWKPEQVDALGKGGKAAYEEFAVSYGIISETSLQREHRLLDEFKRDLKHELLGLLEEERWEARPKIVDLLRRCAHSQRDKRIDPIIEPIAELTERLTMGDLEWAPYKAEILKQLEGWSE